MTPEAYAALMADADALARRFERDAQLVRDLAALVPVPGAEPVSEPVPEPVISGPAEPLTFARITERNFVSAEEDGWRASGMSIASDASAPVSPPSVGQMTYPAGSWDSYDPGWTERSIGALGYRQLYLRWWQKMSANWQGHPSATNKLFYVWLHDKPVVFPRAVGVGAGALMAEVGLQDIPAIAINLPANVLPVELVRGRWHRWEIQLSVGPPGECRWWVDGVLAGEHLALDYGGGHWQTLAWRPIWGGRGGTISETMYLWMDHFYASGAP